MLKVLATPDTTFLATGVYRLVLAIQEDDTMLRNQLVSATLDWGDGTPVVVVADRQPVVLNNATTPVLYEHTYQVGGQYVAKVAASNYRAPTPDTDLYVAFINLSVEAADRAPGQDIKVGPILPRDVGFPNKDQWNFSMARDLLTVESAVKLLLTTVKGERLMEPDFGTSLNRFIFDQNDAVIDGLVQQEILMAVERWAPFVSVQAIQMNRGRDRHRLGVEVQLVAKPQQQPFMVNLSFER
jgi:phage baseplate assembly protein W